MRLQRHIHTTSTQTSAITPHSPRRAFSILVVNRNLGESAELYRHLSDQGFQVINACSAGEALQALVWRYIDLVVTTEDLQDISGHQLVAHLKSLPRFPQNATLPVILLKDASTGEPLNSAADMIVAGHALEQVSGAIHALLETSRPK